MSELTEPQLRTLKEVAKGLRNQVTLGDISDDPEMAWLLVKGYVRRCQDDLRVFEPTKRGREVLVDA